MNAVGVGFSPGVDAARAAGIKVTQEDYPLNRREQLLTSIDKIAIVIRHGKNDPAVVGYTGDVLITAGAKQAGTKRRVGIIVDHIQEIMVYGGDPIGAEYIVSAAGMLCLRKGLCVRLTDCDGLLGLAGSMCAAMGIPVQIVGLYYGEKAQPHVLMVFEDDDGEWKYADPTAGLQPGTRKVALGFTPQKAKEEFWADPLESMNAPEIVIVGAAGLVERRALPGDDRAPLSSAWRRQDGQFWEKNDDGWWRSAGAGSAWNYVGEELPSLSPPIGAGATAEIPGWQLTDISKVVAGKRYFVAALVSSPHLNEPLASDWTIESSEVGSVRVGFAPSYRFVGIAKNNAPANSDSVTYLVVYEEVVGATPIVLGQPPAAGSTAPTVPASPAPIAAPAPGPAPPAPLQDPPAQNLVSIGTVLLGGAVAAGVVGTAWGIVRIVRGKKRGRVA